MDESLARLQGKLLDTSEKLENYSPTSEQALSLKDDLHELLAMLNGMRKDDNNTC